MAFFIATGRLRRRTFFLRVVGLYAAGLLIYAIPGGLYAAEIPAFVKLAAFAGLVAVWYLVLANASALARPQPAGLVGLGCAAATAKLCARGRLAVCAGYRRAKPLRPRPQAAFAAANTFAKYIVTARS